MILAALNLTSAFAQKQTLEFCRATLAYFEKRCPQAEITLSDKELSRLEVVQHIRQRRLAGALTLRSAPTPLSLTFCQVSHF